MIKQTKAAPKRRAIYIPAGHCHVSRYPAVYHSAGVGSCIMLFLYHPASHLAGAAHIDLPPFGPGGFNGVAKTSPAQLINKLLAAGAMCQSLKAKITGGANLFNWQNKNLTAPLGEELLRYVKNELLAHKIYIATENVGGNQGHDVKCYSGTGEVHLRSLTKTRII